MNSRPDEIWREKEQVVAKTMDETTHMVDYNPFIKRHIAFMRLTSRANVV